MRDSVLDLLRVGLLIAVLAGPLNAQTFTRYGTEAGLPSAQVTAIERDALGFVWAGTLSGLCRLDGLAFECFRHDPDLPTSLRDDVVNPDGLHLGPHGRLWVGTGDGLQSIEPETGAFVDAAPPSLRGVSIRGVDHDEAGHLWVGTDRGLVRWAPGSGASRRYRLGTDADSTAGIDGVRVGPDGAIWASTQTGLWRRAPRGGAFRRLVTAEDLPDAFALLPRADGSTWVGSYGAGLWRIESDGRSQRVPLPPGNDRVVAVEEATPGTLWIGTWDGGLLQVEEATGTVERTFLPTPGRTDGLPNVTVIDVYHDADVGTWVATWDGLARLRPPSPFLHLRPPPGRDGLVMALAPRATGGLWVGTLAGLYTADTERPSRAWSLVPGTETMMVRAVVEAADGTLWIGTETDGVWRREAQGGRPVRAFENLPSPLVHALATDAAGTLWIGLSNAGACASTNLRTLDRCLDASTSGGLPTDAVYTLRPGTDGSLWVGTTDRGGVRIRDGVASPLGPENPALARTWVTSIAPTTDGAAWVGTSNGLARVGDRAVPTWVGLAEGLPHASVECVLAEDARYAWAGTGDGLARVDAETGRVASYAGPNGLPVQAFTAGPCTAAEGTLWFGTRDGVVGVVPSRFPRSRPPPPVAFTAVEVDGVARTVGTVRSTDVEAPVGTRRISLQVVGLDYVDPEGLRYAYRLGTDTTWAPVDADGRLELTGLRPGRHAVQIRAINSLGVPSRRVARADVRVLAPVWQRGWFLGLVVLGVALAAYAAHRVRLGHVLALARTRQRIADDLHDDIGSRVSGLAVQLQLTSRDAPEGLAERLSAHGRQAQALAADVRDMVWVVNGRHDTLSALLQRIRQVAFDLLPEADLTLDAAPDLAPRPLSMTTRRHLLLFHNEALHNIQKHACATRVRIAVVSEADGLAFTVEDDGRGFDLTAAEATGGHGLTSMRARASALGGTLTTTARPGAGTRHTLWMPTHRLQADARTPQSRDGAAPSRPPS